MAKHVKAASSMSERELAEHVELWHADMWLVSRDAHAEHHRVYRQFHVHDKPPRYRPPDRIKVAAHEGMSADVLYLHVRTRHPELRYEKLVVTLREQHLLAHELIPAVLGHYHEKYAPEIATQEKPVASG